MSSQCREDIFFLSFFQEYGKYCLAFRFYVSDDNKIEIWGTHSSYYGESGQGREKKQWAETLRLD